MTDPTPLLVPISLQALVVNAAVQGRPFQRWANDYAKLNDFGDPVPKPFENVENTPPDQGVHLHWRLPAALRRGVGDAATGVQFDLTPNRWIIVRLAAAANAVAAPQLTAWIVRSDYLGTDGLSPFADPIKSESGKVVPTKIGKISPIEEWSGEPGGQLFLRATGIADVTFTAYQPGLFGVYAFRDDTTRLTENTQLTYLVAGWYSDVSQDPLARKTPQSLNWQVFGASGTNPNLSVFHGLLHGVVWQTAKAPDRADASARSMQIGVGYTGVDALAAILATRAGQGGGEIERKLQAFQYEMLQTLDAPDGMAQLEQRIRDAWFGSTPSGTRWELAALSQGQQTEDPLNRGTVPPPPPLTAEQERWLAALNVAQRTYDKTRRDLMSAQWELFTLWWKQQYGHVDGVERGQRNFNIKLSVILGWIDEALSTSKPDSIYNAVVRHQQQVETLAKAVPDPTSPDDITEWSKKIPPGAIPLRLKASAMPPFSHPADPVLVIAGITPPPNDIDDSKALPCRTVDAAVTGVRVKTQEVRKTTGSLSRIIQFPTTTALPPAVASAVNALALETFFTDPNNAASIVQNGLGSSDPGTIGTLRDAMRNGTAQLSTIAQPLQAAFAFAAWQQAWSPLYLQWQLTWFATVLPEATGPELPPKEARVDQSARSRGGKDNWPFDARGWSFDGSDDVMLRGSEYYRWTGGDIWPTDKRQQTHTGRTFLTPHATALLVRRLADYVRLHPDDRSVGRIIELIDQVGRTRFLSQALSGFNSAFLMRALRQSPPPAANSPVAKAVEGENRGVPMVEVGNQSLDFGGGRPFFYPARGGYFRFERLIIVDAFGQVLNLLEANDNGGGSAERFQPIRGAGLAPEPNAALPAAERLVRQAPRITQPSRLELRLLDANDDAKEIFYTPQTNPVCGWLLPNHLNRSIAVYDAAGAPLGELLVLVDAAGPAVRWLPSPASERPVTDPSQISNRHLAATFSAFTAATGGIPAAQRPDAFRALLASIDETLWMIDPPGGDDEHDLAVLIGRPLALVRAQIQYELFGRPAQNLSWRNTLQNQTADLGVSRFPIRLGSTELLDDGLIGYFAGTTYTTFNAVHPAAKPASEYVRGVAPGNYLSLPFDFPSYSTQNLSLLLDPRARVHATTGVLPTASIELPSQFYTQALRQLAMTFRSGPVLTPATTNRLPIPAQQNGVWSWIRRKSAATGAAAFDVAEIVAATDRARLEDAPPQLVDGWLKFVPDASKRLAGQSEDDE